MEQTSFLSGSHHTKENLVLWGVIMVSTAPAEKSPDYVKSRNKHVNCVCLVVAIHVKVKPDTKIISFAHGKCTDIVQKK